LPRCQGFKGLDRGTVEFLTEAAGTRFVSSGFGPDPSGGTYPINAKTRALLGIPLAPTVIPSCV
jgi:hypothetical protein